MDISKLSVVERKALVLEALEETEGVLDKAVKLAGVGRAAVFRYKADDEMFAGQIAAITKKWTDRKSDAKLRAKGIDTNNKPRSMKIISAEGGKKEKSRLLTVETNATHIRNRQGSNPTDPAEKSRIVNLICEMFEQGGFSIVDCCIANTISFQTFYRWAIDSKATQFSDLLASRYETAKKIVWELERSQIAQAAKTSLKLLIEEREIEETSREGRILTDPKTGEPLLDENGDHRVVPYSIKKVQKRIQPNSAVVMYALNRLDSLYAEPIKGLNVNLSGGGGQSATDEYKMRGMSDDLLNQEEARYAKLLEAQ